jgi:hypothetical protein
MLSGISIDKTTDVLVLDVTMHLVLGREFNISNIVSALFKYNRDTVCVIVAILLRKFKRAQESPLL